MGAHYEWKLREPNVGTFVVALDESTCEVLAETRATVECCLPDAQCSVYSLADGRLNNVTQHNAASIEPHLEASIVERVRHATSAADVSSFSTNHHRITLLPIHVYPPVLAGVLAAIQPEGSSLAEPETRVLNLAATAVSAKVRENAKRLKFAKVAEMDLMVTQNNPDKIFVKDEQFRIIYGNPAFLSIYPEHMRESLFGTTTVEDYPEAEASKFLEQDRIAFETGESTIIEDIHTPSGEFVILETLKRRFVDSEQKRYILGVAKDVTEREMAIRNLRKANQELDDIVGIASHDLKSPLNAIERLLSWVEEDCGDSLPEDSRENLQTARQRAARMRRLLDDLLKYAKLGHGNEPRTVVDLKTTVDDIYTLLDFDDTRFTLTVEPMELRVQPTLLKTVLLNLISNALKHNTHPEGTVKVYGSANRYSYQISVEDDGPGIPQRYQDRIFKLFYTLRSRDEVEGSGVGLSVVKKIIESLNGAVAVRSDGQQGTRFDVRWPR